MDHPFMQSLECTRDIKIVVGTELPKTFYAQQQLLEQTSEFFVKALRNQHLGQESEKGVLKFPMDDIAAWQALLFWMYKGNIPWDNFEDATTVVIRAWVLGDKLCISDFQNQAMLALLRLLPNQFTCLVTIEEAVKSTAYDSLMRRVMAEEVAQQLRYSEVNTDELDDLDGCGFLQSVLDRNLSFPSIGYFERGLDKDGKICNYNQVNKYMVGRGLTKADSI